jgi:hypothetical protein
LGEVENEAGKIIGITEGIIIHKYFQKIIMLNEIFINL